MKFDLSDRHQTGLLFVAFAWIAASLVCKVVEVAKSDMLVLYTQYIGQLPLFCMWMCVCIGTINPIRAFSFRQIIDI